MVTLAGPSDLLRIVQGSIATVIRMKSLVQLVSGYTWLYRNFIEGLDHHSLDTILVDSVAQRHGHDSSRGSIISSVIRFKRGLIAPALLR